MSVASEITRLQNAKSALKTSIENKGVTVSDNTLLSGYSALVDQIQTGGGGGNEDLIDLIERDITTFNIPSGTTKIGQYAFQGCTGLTSVTIPNGITTIGDYAFQSCTSLTSITIPNSVTSIGSSAFNGCTGLTSITIPDGVTTIGNNGFYNCTGLTSVTIPDSVTSIRDYAFSYCNGLTSVTIGSGTTTIGSYAFQNSTNLTSVTVLATTPPTLGYTVFATNVSGRKIYVPAESVEAYKTTGRWTTYAADIEAIPTE